MQVTIQGMGICAPFGDINVMKAILGEGDMPAPSMLKADTTALSQYIPARKLRRIDHFTRMSLLAAYRALEDAGRLDELPPRLGIVITTGYGPSQTTFDFLDSIIEDGAPLASPLAFSHSVHNIPAGVLSMQLGTPCPQTTICQLRQPVTAGLRTAALWLAEGTADAVLLGAVDESTPLLEENMRRLSASDEIKVDEGAAFFLLNATDEGNARVAIDNLPIAEQQATGCHSAQFKMNTPISAAFELAAAALSCSATGQSFICREGSATVRVDGMSDD